MLYINFIFSFNPKAINLLSRNLLSKMIQEKNKIILCLFLFFIYSCSNSEQKSLDSKIKINIPTTAEMVLIPEGIFQMGSDNKTSDKIDEKPLHEVYLSAYFIDKFEVTNRQYKKFITETGHSAPYIEDKDWAKPFNWINNNYPENQADFPVVLVNWYDATAYAKWAGKRLPTEAEWEKAARGGLLNNVYPFGNKLEFNQASFDKGYVRGRKIDSAGTYQPNPYGIFDMSGNVWEWCQDWYTDKYYNDSPYKNPPGPANGIYKVFRGGSWISDKKYLKCAFRGKNTPEYRSPSLGFRCALSNNPDD